MGLVARGLSRLSFCVPFGHVLIGCTYWELSPGNVLTTVATWPLLVVLLALSCMGQAIVFFYTKVNHEYLKVTAIKTALVRAEINAMGRQDEATERLLRCVPWAPQPARVAMISYLSLPRMTGLRWHVYPLSAKLEARGIPFGQQISLRSQVIDMVVEAGKDKAQLVILGAGMDTRCYQPRFAQDRACFEVDFGPTQNAKRAAVLAAGLDSSRVTYVAVDFTRESWLDKLVEKGFSTSERTIFIWEGVTYHLPAAAIASTVQLFRQCAMGSVLVLDYFTDMVVNSTSFSLVQRMVKWLDEPLLFAIGRGFDEDPAEAWVRAQGLKLVVSMVGGRPGERWGGAFAAELPPS